MALSGNLRDFSLPDVFQLISFSHKTGTLAIERGDARGFVYFQDGDVFFAISNWNREPMGRRLVRAGKITERQLQRALEIQGDDDGQRRLGQILVDEGFLTSKVLETFVQEQIQDTIFDLFRWEEGDFDFKAGAVPSEEDVGLSVSVENIIMEGSRRLEEWNRIRKKIPNDECVFRMATAPGEGTFEVSLKPSEWKLLCLLDGKRTLAELSRLLDLSDFQVARVLYGMFSGGLLERTDAAALREAEARAKAEEAELQEPSATEIEVAEPPEEVQEEAEATETSVEQVSEEAEVPQAAPEEAALDQAPPDEAAAQEVAEEEAAEEEAEPEQVEPEAVSAQAEPEQVESQEHESSEPAESEESLEADLESIIEAAESGALEEPPEGVETAETPEFLDVPGLADEDEIDTADLDLSDELEALTGSGGGKPKTGRMPKTGAKTQAKPLQADKVSKDLLVKLIDGIKRL